MRLWCNRSAHHGQPQVGVSLSPNDRSNVISKHLLDRGVGFAKLDSDA
jgi:hypothetical protein